MFVQGFKGKVRDVNVEPVDTTGAGDAFVSGILYNIASDPSIFEVIRISLHILVVDLKKSCECLDLMKLFCVAG
jgi:sugar/nucleoside kinase (ribokinase family)